MRQELWIDGQRMDLSADTVITLEWVSGLFEDIGSIQMSRSYTIRLPKTARNLRILDDPGNPAYLSSKTRRYLDAQYHRNGIDLLGPAKAYVMSVEPDGIEVGLLWRTVDGLLEWKESGKKLSDLTSLPTLTWVGSDGWPDYTREYFAKYVSGLGSYSFPTVNAAPHPSVQFWELFARIFAEAGVRWDGYVDDEQNELGSLYYTKLLCGTHRPDRAMEIASGSYAASANAYNIQDEGKGIAFNDWTHGWDPIVHEYAGYDGFEVGENKKVRVVVNLRNDLSDYTIGFDEPIRITDSFGETIAEYYFETDADGIEHCSADEELDLSGYDVFEVRFGGAKPNAAHPLSAYDPTLPAFSVMHVHEHIRIDQQNQFPVAENLPDMTQVDFIKGACALLGLVPIVTPDRVLKFVQYSAILDTAGAQDWTRKVSGELERVELSRDGLARRNYIRWAEDVRVKPSPDAAIVTEDDTIAESMDLYKLPFAASNERIAEHYKITSEFNDETLVTTYEAEDIDIKPRVFVWAYDSTGERYLAFPEYLKGAGLVAKYYSRFQDITRKPVVIEVLVRLNELDLVALDFTKPVYLAQTGQYYAVKTVQADDSDLCKVELIQIA